MKPNRVSLRQIAAELDVSVSMVSRVLSGRMGSAGASQASIAAIRTKAAELGYRPNPSAAGLRQGRHNVIGLFIHKVGVEGSGLVEDMVDGVAAAARCNGQRLHLAFHSSADELHTAFAGAHANSLDGLIVGGIAHPELTSWLLRLRQDGLPVVTIHDAPVHPAIPNVRTDQQAVSALAVRHLVARGCRRLGMLGCPGERSRGFMAALAELGLEVRPERIIEVGSARYYEEGRNAAAAVAASGADGVYAQSDQLAVGLLNGLLALGVAVPERLRVIGVDDSPFCRFSFVSLSSIYQDHHTAGRTALEMVMRMLKDEPAGSAEIAPVLRPRQSTAAPDPGRKPS